MQCLKFRAYLKDEDRWADSVTIYGDGSIDIEIDGMNVSMEGHLKTLAVEQFTGMYDQHEREIYVGDFYRHPDCGTVVICSLPHVGMLIDQGVRFRYGEVVGNIHLNPNLVNHA
jgi:hypothetical protein